MSKVTRRIGLLIAHAKGTPIAEESEAFLAKARELASNHDIDISTLLDEDTIEGVLRGAGVNTIPFKIRLNKINQANRALAIVIINRHGFYTAHDNPIRGRYVIAMVDNLTRGEAIQRSYDRVARRCLESAERYVKNVLCEEGNSTGNIDRAIAKESTGIIAAMALRIGENNPISKILPYPTRKPARKGSKAVGNTSNLVCFTYNDDHVLLAGYIEMEEPLEDATQLLEAHSYLT